jgi:hypothetical protein
MDLALDFQRVITFILLFLCHKASAFDAGDAIALILGLIIGILGICACIGAYAKRKGAA